MSSALATDRQFMTRIRCALAAGSDTWTRFDNERAQSRLYGGVHFRSAVQAGALLCKPMGDLAFEFVDSHIKGMPRSGR